MLNEISNGYMDLTVARYLRTSIAGMRDFSVRQLIDAFVRIHQGEKG